ncbi:MULTISPECIES: hypothetical protein [unclassified Kitasatospora]|uniref:hypothetical protein n=1 Tax=unclassified Kitasatospora TaxID=2633591 RepID=UPI00070CC44A|nr:MULTISPECIES: hypothetical protein [unclassified Kitasatospora]KQV05651.1 hypothetical protein ASC99_12695 [Kitasatospora sp. Root107]KRB62455.1 hypothetical protein ASE03_07655 [Kitasatospora sp. Root187]
MRTWRTVLSWSIAVLAAVAAVSGCGAAGRLHDAGPASPIAVRPSPQLLWAAVETPSVPVAEAADQAPPPTPLPGITVPGGDLRAVQARSVLEKDPALRGEELKALTGCQGCTVRQAEYRDLGGDGGAELITAVLTGSETGYLHVYTLRDGRLYAVLSQRVVAGFTAETVGQDLVVREPIGPQARTDTTYRWTDLRLAPLTGPAAEATLCEPVGVAPSAAPTSHPKAGSPEPKVSVVPTLPPGKGAGPVPAKPSS